MEAIPEGFVDITNDKDGGVLKKITKEGIEEDFPNDGDTVFVHYTGTLYGGERDGEKFDSSKDRDEQFSFQLGNGSVIKSWDLGVATMKKGEVCELICAPAYAYGDSGSGNAIPPKSTLKFEVELFSWHGEDITKEKDLSITRRILHKGVGYDTPKQGCKVKVELKGTNCGQMFDMRTVEFTLGMGKDENIIEGVEKAIKKMNKGEKSKFDIKAKHAYGQAGNVDFGIMPDTDIQYEVNLLDYEKFKESYEFDNDDERLTQSALMKTNGTDCFKKGNYELAVVFYKKIISYLEYNEMTEDEEKGKQRNALLTAAYSNNALCYFKTGKYEDCIAQCEKALELDENNEKVNFRLAEALYCEKKYDDALVYFCRVLKINAGNVTARNKAMDCEKKVQEMKQKEKSMYKNMMTGLFKSSKGDSVPEKITENLKNDEGETAMNGDETSVNGEASVNGDSVEN